MKTFEDYIEEAQEKEFGVRWSEAKGENMVIVQKEKFFKTQKELDKFVEKLKTKDSFIEIIGWSI